MARLYLFFITSSGGQKGHMLPRLPPPPPPPRHCRIMNDFFGGWRSVFFFGGGGGALEFANPFYPYPTQSIYICVGVVAERADRKVLFVLEYYGTVNTI